MAFELFQSLSCIFTLCAMKQYPVHLFMCLKDLSFYIYLSHPLLNNKEMIQFKKYLASAYYVL